MSLVVKTTVGAEKPPCILYVPAAPIRGLATALTRSPALAQPCSFRHLSQQTSANVLYTRVSRSSPEVIKDCWGNGPMQYCISGSYLNRVKTSAYIRDVTASPVIMHQASSPTRIEIQNPVLCRNQADNPDSVFSLNGLPFSIWPICVK